MIIVLDTNVYISGVISPHGNPYKTIRAWENGKINLATSEEILTEINKVFLYPRIQKRLKWSKEKIDEYINLLRLTTITVSGKTKVHVATDPHDNKFLSCAGEAKADAIITGDKKHLLPLGSFKGILIVTPKQFVENYLK